MEEEFVELVGPMGAIVMTKSEAEKALKTGKFRLRWENGAPEEEANDAAPLEEPEEIELEDAEPEEADE